MRFSFIFIIQQELDAMKSMWNTHYIREVWHSEWPPGWTNIFYVTPEQSGGRSFRFPVDEMDINSCHPFCELLPTLYCTGLWEENFRRGSFYGGSFYNFNPYTQNWFRNYENFIFQIMFHLYTSFLKPM